MCCFRVEISHPLKGGDFQYVSSFKDLVSFFCFFFGCVFIQGFGESPFKNQTIAYFLFRYFEDPSCSIMLGFSAHHQIRHFHKLITQKFPFSNSQNQTNSEDT